MGQQEITPEEKKVFINYMLDNKELEKAIQKKYKVFSLYQLSVFGSILKRCEDNAGFIVAVNSDEIPSGADNIGFYTELTKGCNMQNAAKEDGTKYVMVFTSKKRFKEAGELSGVVMPIEVFIGVICLKKKEIDGIVINPGKEELIIETAALEFLLKCIDLSKSV